MPADADQGVLPHQLWNLGPARALGVSQSLSSSEGKPYQPFLPFQSFTESFVRTAQSNAQSTLALYQQDPHFQRGLQLWSQWEDSLRNETTQRLGRFKPPPQLVDGQKGILSEDWDLLKRVQLKLPTGGLKRAASETSLGSLGHLGCDRKHSKSQEQSAEVEEVSSSSFTGTFVYRLHGKTKSSAGDGQASRSLASSPSLRDLSEHARQLNPEAVKGVEEFIHRSKLVIQSAHQSIQRTAANCQQNLQALSSIFQQNSHHLQSALSGSSALVTWSLVSSTDPLGSVNDALAPWSVFPRYLQARELNAVLQSDEQDKGDRDWLRPFQDYMDSLERKCRHKQYSSLREPGRQVAIVTTASLPWLTGTSVNPLLRAAYMSADGNRKVTLVIPWLSPADQQRVFPANLTFQTPEDQEAYVREWAKRRTGLDCDFKVTFYPGRYAAEKGSILPVGDITSLIPDHEADVAVLEEPEHLNWYHHGRRWTDKFNHVVGVMHTNYLDYARREEGGNVKEMILKYVNAWVCRIYCHKVIKLSDAVQRLPREQTMFVHGVSPTFIKVGEKKAQQAVSGEKPWSKGVYFLGKVLWAKGYTELLDRLKEHATRTGENVCVDVYGSGPDLKAVEEEASQRHLNLKFNGACDHADESIHDYKVFVNPSLSDVVATTTAEALAMGKFVVCAEHPSNAFFKQFPNCLVYRTSEEFTDCLKKALRNEPEPLSPSDLHKLTWEAATERFMDVAELEKTKNPLEIALDNFLAATHNTLSGIEPWRIAAGAGPNTRDMPIRVTDYVPCEDYGGLFDNQKRAKQAYSK